MPGHHFKQFQRNRESLRRIWRETQLALEDIKRNHLLSDDIKAQLYNPALAEALQLTLDRTPCLVVCGQSCSAKARFVNALLQDAVLPTNSTDWRWVKLSSAKYPSIRLTIGGDIEIVEYLRAHQAPWHTVPAADLRRAVTEPPSDPCPMLDVELAYASHQRLLEHVTVMLPPDTDGIDALRAVLASRYFDQLLPAFVYVISSDTLSDISVQEIGLLKERYADSPIIFVSLDSEAGTATNGSVIAAHNRSTESLTESEQHQFESNPGRRKLKKIRVQLTRFGYLPDVSNTQTDSARSSKNNYCNDFVQDSTLIDSAGIVDRLPQFIQDVMKVNLLKMSAQLSEIHSRHLRVFILSAFDLAREIQITPRRLQYAQEVELKLYRTLMQIASKKHDEIERLIQVTLQNMKANMPEVLEGYTIGSRSPNEQHSTKLATMEIHELVLRKLSNSVATQLLNSITCLHENFTGTLQRTLECLERNYYQRETSDRDNSLLASDAVKQILSAAYQIDLKASTSFSLVQTFMDKLRKLVHSFQLPWSQCSQTRPLDVQWQLGVVADMLDTISAGKLAKTISAQFQEHVRTSHEAFQSAVRSLEQQLNGQLEQTEDIRVSIRKQHAPRFARLALESTSLCDVVRWGMPRQTREIGRGQYGVVFACEPWGGVNPCAIKSVVPPDDRHWHDLAMEFYYTRTIPEHPRIVGLRGSVIDLHYGSGNSAAVLLVMERMTRDLFCGLQAGLSWTKRIRIAIDVVEGIRYLHSQGLVHRDIKLKNVLLDGHDRAKLTDFGFCIPEAMMSGSIVGTPVHMAPELLSGRYDSSVDVYAFGILFWYICAGQVKLPNHFIEFHNKEQLWKGVSRGCRPECLSDFTMPCWQLMEQCWAAEPADRPLLGHVQPQLEGILEHSTATHNLQQLQQGQSNVDIAIEAVSIDT